MNESLSLPLVLIPGMGVDARLFAPQIDAMPQIVVPRWIKPEPRESLAAYAKRFAVGLPDGPCILGSVSFGGMLAQEVIHHLPGARACLLISTVWSARELPWYLRLVGTLAGGMPSVATWLLLRVGGTLGWPFSKDVRAGYAMLCDSDARFVTWAVRAVLRWPGAAPCPVPEHRLHGMSDTLLPCPRDYSSEAVPGGTHLLPLTRPAEVTRWLQEQVARYAE